MLTKILCQCPNTEKFIRVNYRPSPQFAAKSNYLFIYFWQVVNEKLQKFIILPIRIIFSDHILLDEIHIFYLNQYFAKLTVLLLFIANFQNFPVKNRKTIRKTLKKFHWIKINYLWFAKYLHYGSNLI